MEEVSAETCVHSLKQAGHDAFNTLKEKVKDHEWLEDFLKAGGLEVIVHELYFSIHFPSKDLDTSRHGDSLPFRFVSSLRQVLNNVTGFDDFMSHPDYTKKLLRCLHCTDVKVKQSIVEILAALILLYEDGHQYVLDALYDYKVTNKHVYSCQVIVQELKIDDPEYQAILLAFVNCVVCNEDFNSRVNLRNELNELGFYEILDTLGGSENQNLLVQWHAFCHLEEEDTFYQQVTDKQDDDAFDDVDNLLTDPAFLKQMAAHNSRLLCSFVQALLKHPDMNPVSGSLQQSLHRFTQTRNVDELMKVVLQENGQQTKEVSDDIDSVEPDSDVPDGPPPPPIFSLSRSPLKGTRWKDNEHAKQLLDKMTKPSKSMIGLPWKKVDRLTESDNGSIWREVVCMEDPIPIDTVALETHFAQETVSRLKLRRSEETKMDDKRRRKVDITLKAYPGIKQAVLQLKAGKTDIETETLEQLSKLKPDPEELEAVRKFKGDKSKLREAEQFFLLFEDFHNYKDFIELALLRKKLPEVSDGIKRNIEATVLVCEQIMNSWSLKAFLRYVLHIGNFINHSKGTGKAVGFNLASLRKLSDLKSSVNDNRTLLHHLVGEIETKNPPLLKFVDDLHANLTDVSRFDDIGDDLKKFKDNVRTTQDIKDTRVKEHFSEFFKHLQKTTKELDGEERRFEVNNSRMQQYFCVREDGFKLQEFLQTLKKFCDQVKEVRKKTTLKKSPRHSLTNRNPGISSSPETGRPLDQVASRIIKGQYPLRKTQSHYNIVFST